MKKQGLIGVASDVTVGVAIICVAVLVGCAGLLVSPVYWVLRAFGVTEVFDVEI